MGIQGLLPLLKSIHRRTTLKAYAGQTLGVDAFGWLHRGAVACAYQLANDKPTTQYVAFVVNRVRMLLDFGIEPYLVFDGDSVPSKAGTNDKRRREREAAKAFGHELYRAGKRDQAQQEWQKAVSITPQMTFDIIEAMRHMKVRVIVAPFEADAQLAYLEREGIIDGILSEDSDLLVFGAKRLITKLDQHGSCVEINRAEFILNKDISFAGWSDSMFRRMAILSGCDYLPSIGKIGLKTAHEYVKKYKEIIKITRMMGISGKYSIPKDYVERFNDAERTFLYHRVFCPKAGKMVLLNTLPPDLNEEQMPYIGKYVEADIALGVACGDLNPKTKEPFVSSSKHPLVSARRLQNYRRQTTDNAMGLKSKGSLDSFFKPQRTPLAELDPNSLTPSPSQQRLLERNRSASWEPRLVNSAPHSAPPLRHVASERPSQSERSSFVAKAAAPSTHKPAKRQRLCSESDEVSPSKEIKQSRFFSPNSVEHSPLSSKRSRDRKSKKAAFDVFSDDSVEEAFLSLERQNGQKWGKTINLPDLPSLSTSKEAAEEPDVIPQSSPVKSDQAAVDSQSSHGTVEMNNISLQPQGHSQTSRTKDKKEANTPEAFASLLEYHLQRHSEGIGAHHRAFSSQSPERQAAALASLKPVISSPELAEVSQSCEPEVEDLKSPIAAPSSKFRDLARTFACQSPQLQIKALSSLRYPQSSKISHPLSNSAAQGSEDALPCSSSQPEDAASESEEPPPRKKLDFNSFQYLAS